MKIEQFIFQVTEETVYRLVNKLLPRFMIPNQWIAGLFKKATGVELSVDQFQVYEQIIRSELIQELSNSRKNMEMALLKAFGIVGDRMNEILNEHYSAQTGISIGIQALLNQYLTPTHPALAENTYNSSLDSNNSNNVVQQFDNLDYPYRLYRLQIQKYLRSILDGALYASIRQAQRTIIEKSFGTGEKISNISLENFALYKQQSRQRGKAQMGNTRSVNQDTAEQAKPIVRCGLV